MRNDRLCDYLQEGMLEAITIQELAQVNINL